MKEIWVVGGGKFGQKAVLKLGKKFPDHDMICVEKNAAKCESLSNGVCKVYCEDGIGFLTYHLKKENPPEWIVPAIPIHVVFHYLETMLFSKSCLVPVQLPAAFLKALPNPIIGSNNEVYVSVADFICPDNCPEPADFCTVTHKKRAFYLYDRIADRCPEDFHPIVIRSHQLAPGVGGILPQDIFNALETIRISTKPIVLATACKCHGVISPFRLSRNLEN